MSFDKIPRVSESTVKQSAQVSPKKTAQQLGKIYSLFHRKKIVKELELKLNQIARNELPPGENADKIIMDAQWVANKVLTISARKKAKRNFTPHVMAARLKIPVEALHQNPDFVSFVNKNHLTRTLGTIYEGKLTQVEDEKIMIQCSPGGFRPWTELKKEIGEDFSSYCFTDQGLIKHNPDKWDTMVPYRTLPVEERPKTFQMTLVTDTFRDTIEEKGTEFEDHSWIRLTKPTGEVYSFGFYPEDVLIASPRNALATTHGVIKCPDLNEYLPLGTLTTWDLELDEEAFNRIMEAVEKRQKDQANPLQYSVTGYNCTDFALDVMKLAGKLPDEEHARTKINLLVPKKLYSVGKALSKVLTKKAQKSIQKRIMRLLGSEKYFKDNQLVGEKSTVEKIQLMGGKIQEDREQMTHPRILRQKMMHKEYVRKLQSEISQLEREQSAAQGGNQQRLELLKQHKELLDKLEKTEKEIEGHVKRRDELQALAKRDKGQRQELKEVRSQIRRLQREHKRNLQERAKMGRLTFS